MYLHQPQSHHRTTGLLGPYMSTMTPREIVSELDKHIIGQDEAKRAVAIALRNRWRRMQLPEELRAEIDELKARFGRLLDALGVDDV